MSVREAKLAFLQNAFSKHIWTWSFFPLVSVSRLSSLLFRVPHVLVEAEEGKEVRRLVHERIRHLQERHRIGFLRRRVGLGPNPLVYSGCSIEFNSSSYYWLFQELPFAINGAPNIPLFLPFLLPASDFAPDETNI